MNNAQLIQQRAMLEVYIDLNVRPEESFGLCDNVLMESYGEKHEDYWDDVFRSWPCFAGSVAYPVEGNSRAYANNTNQHDRRTKYGKLRLSLAKHCLEHVMNELKELEQWAYITNTTQPTL
tara:strand:- start:582 stop:944 length:363 start_codon:yes stop_codon:yes gene_type:complete